ncbi:MAG: MFS transporter [Rikenellaceae bacterium]
MIKIETGRGTIPLMTLLAIWSISLVVNLPGLAISPILGNMETIFPGTSQLEVQLLTILPNLFIIPFVLLSGRLSLSSNKILILVVALIIYLSSGVLYFFASSMTQLIVISCMLGIGCGLLIPLAAGLLTDFFIGKYRMKQLGIKSGIANMSLVVATLAVGWLGAKNWHLPFVVYLLPLVPLLFTPFLRGDKGKAENSAEIIGFLDKGKLISIVFQYGFITFIVSVISYYFPFLAQSHGIGDSAVGIITALFFFFIMAPGFVLPYVIKLFRGWTSVIMIFSLGLGLLVMLSTDNVFMYGLGAVLMGFGYGTMQPVIYDKAAEASSGKKSTLALAIVLAMNYVAVTIAPFIVDLFKDIFHTQTNHFPFVLDLVLVVLYLAYGIVRKSSFAFAVNKEYL